MDANLLTFIVSDMHLSEAQEVDPERPLWMAYKYREFFIDDDFARFLDYIQEQADEPIELILNGDIFDFDNVTIHPRLTDRKSRVNFWRLVKKAGFSP